MPLSTGEQLGHYTIQSLIGKGGMGEVYQALDTKLDREVAIKVLPAALASEPDRLARFEREAKVLAQLNHSGIASIYGLEGRALVMELVPGPTLAERIAQGPIPAVEAEEIFLQIADALEYAHERGIIHRDLKPANIKIDPEDKVKILDFGLAKALSDPTASAGGDPTDSPTITMGGTIAGTILGTAAYMAPEQARGKKVDRRADIWAFGVVVWEMLTGERLFKGEDTVQVLSRVLEQQPDLERVPGKFRKLLGRCLDRNPKERLRDIGEARFLLREEAGGADGPAAEAEASVAGLNLLHRQKQSKVGWALAAVLGLGLGALALVHFRETSPPEQTTRYSITLPENSSIHSFALSPDGRTLVIAAAVNGKRQLYLRPMDALQIQPMAFTEEATFPFWSPDSRFIGFFAQGKLNKVAASGGPSLALCDAPDGTGGSWNRDDVIVFSPDRLGKSIRRVAAAGGVPADVMKAQGGNLRYPVFLPDGGHFLFMIGNGTAEQNGIWVSSMDQKGDGNQNRRLLADVSGAQFAPSARRGQPAHLLFVRQNTLMAVPFDASSAEVSVDVFPVADGVGLTANLFYAPVTVSEHGVLLYESGGAAGSQMVWYDRTGKQLGEVGAPGPVDDPAISPDEKQVAFRRATGAGGDLWLRDLSRGTETRFTSDPSSHYLPFWSPKGDRIVFNSNRKGGIYNLYQKAANGSGQDELLLPSSLTDAADQWSRDGRFIVFHRVDPKTKRDIWVLPMEGPGLENAAERKPIPFLQTEFEELFGQLSPDSHWMAFNSDRSGRREVYVRPFHFPEGAGEGEYSISIAGVDMPRWRGDGKELFFEAADGKMMAVPVKSASPGVAGAKPTFEAGAPVALFDAHMVNSGTSLTSEYDVTADGKRFLVNTTGGAGASAPPLTVVTNWQAGLKK